MITVAYLGDVSHHKIRVEILIDSNSCTNPSPIKGFGYINQFPFSVMEPLVLDGLCRGVDAGPVDLEVWGYNVNNGTMAGSHSQPIFIVEEIADNFIAITND